PRGSGGAGGGSRGDPLSRWNALDAGGVRRETRRGDPMTTEPEVLNFEAALARLEAVVSRLESGELTLAESLRTFEEGISLSRQCAERLNQVEARIEYLIRTADGGYAAEPFSMASDGGVSTTQ